jgi:hypothetical protein
MEILMALNIVSHKFPLLLLVIGFGALYASLSRAEDDDAPARTVAPPPTTVSATINIDGKPVAGGRIFFHLPRDQFAGGRIKAGKCQLDFVPTGSYKITIESNGVPEHYSSLEQTHFAVEVVPGLNVLTIELVSD